jgi:hypothetical protein
MKKGKCDKKEPREGRSLNENASHAEIIPLKASPCVLQSLVIP